MKVKLLVGLSGSAGSWQPGDSYDCEAPEAARLIDAGFAELIGERAEQAVKPAPRKRRSSKSAPDRAVQ